VTTATSAPVFSVPTIVEAGLRRVRSEQQRVTRLLVGGPKYRRLSALYEQEARWWTLLARHTVEPVHRRAAIDNECHARARARQYAEYAQRCRDGDQAVRR
jgi:hypothetical protein